MAFRALSCCARIACGVVGAVRLPVGTFSNGLRNVRPVPGVRPLPGVRPVPGVRRAEIACGVVEDIAGVVGALASFESVCSY
jgi:hypothetical protein